MLWVHGMLFKRVLYKFTGHGKQNPDPETKDIHFAVMYIWVSNICIWDKVKDHEIHPIVFVLIIHFKMLASYFEILKKSVNTTFSKATISDIWEMGLSI